MREEEGGREGVREGVCVRGGREEGGMEVEKCLKECCQKMKETKLGNGIKEKEEGMMIILIIITITSTTRISIIRVVSTTQ